MKSRPRTSFTMKLLGRRCAKCGAKLNNQVKRCKRCHATLSRPKK
jgi:ribosomal protein L40E